MPSFFFFFIFFSLLTVISFITPSAAQQLPDQPTMSALRNELSLPQWSSGPTTNSTYCSWRGVTCSSSTLSVVKLQLPRLNLRGTISPFISRLSSLKLLDLSYNSLHGPIPPSLGALAALEYLDLSMNKLSGSIPPSLSNAVTLKCLNVSNNLLSGPIPDELKNLTALEELQISGNVLSGYVPEWVGWLTELRVFAAYENKLTGKIPESLGSVFSELRVLNLHSNSLNGAIPGSIFSSGKLEVLVLTANRLDGTIPESIGNCRGLSSVRIGDNRLLGRIPSSICNASSLTYFEADNNLISGEIPQEFANCSNLTLLSLASNELSGSVPLGLGELRNLQEIILSNNRLTGDIPKSLLRCRNLSKLDLSNNRFTGNLPHDLCNLSRLQFLNLDCNNIHGDIPPEIGSCVRLLELQLGSNLFTGIVPSEIGMIKNLQVALNLSSNRLHGPLPKELGKLDKLVSLDVSNNRLSGDIPAELKGMLSLIEVNFSNNRLTGPIPVFVPFQNNPASSFSGNDGLCGDPLVLDCEYSDYGVATHKISSYKMVLTVVGSGLTVFATVSVVVILFMMKEKQELQAKAAVEAVAAVAAPPPEIVAGNVFVESMKQAVDFNSVVRASLKDANKLSSGTFSTVYEAVMPSGLVLYVKRLKSVDRTVVHYQSKMIRELERLGNLSHANLMRPLGYVIYEDVALLLHHHMPNGTLAQYLHENPKQDDYKPNWPVRLSISIGVAEGLAFLHQVATIHLDISSSNVFLDSQFNAVIGEIEISKLLDPSKGTASISAVAGSFGYIPPEYAYTMQVTAPGNVYSFGVVLLEILTSRLAVDEQFGEGIDLVKWVQGASTRGETPEQIMDTSMSTVSFSWRKQMLAVLKVAMLCTDSTPAKRPKMKKVAEMLAEIERT